jgi:micrococcal nuclease
MFAGINRRLDVRRRRRRIVPSFWRRRPWASFLILLLVAAALLARRDTASTCFTDEYGKYHDKVFRVARVVDGDTVDLDVADGNHRFTRVRLWGVDTPEVAIGGRPPMHFGPEASAYAKTVLQGQSVRVTLLRGRHRDKYGRLLGYLRLADDDVTFNERLVSTGHGYADWRFEHPHKERFLKAERLARRSRIGLWRGIRTDQMPRWRQRSRGGRRPAAVTRPSTSSSSRPRAVPQ